MRVCTLSSVKNRIVLGAPLPFSVRDASHLLLLARGQVIADEEQLESLFRRGAVVEIDELANAVQSSSRADEAERRVARLSADWERSAYDARRALAAPSAQMAEALRGATGLLLSLIDDAPEVALSQVVRQAEDAHYGVSHSIHAATACLAAARYLGWDPTSQRRAFQAALTMNISMLELQARLAHQISPLTALQRETIHEHPVKSADMLAEAGIDDQDWLDAVATHHELPDGSGYPRGRSDISDLAEMLRFADIYTARLSGRATRPAMSAAQAGRELHQVADSSPLAAALIKAFGIFPPGSLVRLASGEQGLVVRNGEKAHLPIVAALTNAQGEPRLKPVMRDSARQEHAVVALLSARSMPMRLSDEAIVGLIAAG
ncbi:HD-GYP domain-containing protein [Pelomonas sp. KK5]|uniref:HD-GYP domain-containing protein n=1 Tax=Pelomonas sp. KK5 TaxID=1855730 RepID=UPI00097C68D0|nr:HD domain-containing phosphohydrolase [Pelomonas sp. KK5]